MILRPKAEGRRPKFVRTEHLATAKDQNYGYGPTMSSSEALLLELVSKEMQTLRFGTLCGKSPGNFIPEDSQSSKTQKLTHNSAPFQLLLVSVASLNTETVLANIGTDYTANCTMGSKQFSSHMSYLK